MKSKSIIGKALGLKPKPILHKILKTTPGGFHCWVESSVGVIRKETRNCRELTEPAAESIETVFELAASKKKPGIFKKLFSK